MQQTKLIVDDGTSSIEVCSFNDDTNGDQVMPPFKKAHNLCRHNIHSSSCIQLTSCQQFSGFIINTL